MFKGHNRNGSKKWTTTCTVTDAEPGRVFAFDVKSLVVPVAHWRYDIEPVDGGCTVTEQTWDRRPGWFRKPAGMATGVKDRPTANAKNIEAHAGAAQGRRPKPERRPQGLPVITSATRAIGDVVARPPASCRSASL